MKKIINGVTITGNEHWLEIETECPECEEEDCRSYFIFRGNKYYLDEILSLHNKVWCPNPPEFMKGFDGYDDNILIKIHKSGDAVKAYSYF